MQKKKKEKGVKKREKKEKTNKKKKKKKDAKRQPPLHRSRTPAYTQKAKTKENCDIHFVPKRKTTFFNCF